MKSNFKKCLFVFSCALISYNQYAQTAVIHFEDVIIPDDFTSISKSIEIIPDDYAPYSFSSMGTTLFGSQAYWGNFSGFDCSRNTDTVESGYVNDNSCIAGMGANETSQYVVSYLQQDYGGNPAYSLPDGVKLFNDSAKSLLGFYVTNTTLTYKYIVNNLDNISKYQLIIRGFNEGVLQGDSILVDLLNITASETVLLKGWSWIDLQDLGPVDSLTFQLYSDDITTYTPLYFAFDEITIKDPETPSSLPEMNVSSVVVSPNPVQNKLFVQGLKAANHNIIIFDMLGNVQYQFKGNEEAIEIDMNTWMSGTYILQIQNDKGQMDSRKIIKL